MRISKCTEPSTGRVRFSGEPGTHHENEQAVDEPRDDQLGSAPAISSLVTQQLQQQLKLEKPLCLLRSEVNERRKQGCKRVRPRALEQVLRAEHNRCLVSPRLGQRREPTWHCR